MKLTKIRVMKSPKGHELITTKVGNIAYIDVYHVFSCKHFKTIKCLWFVRFQVMGAL